MEEQARGRGRAGRPWARFAALAACLVIGTGVVMGAEASKTTAPPAKSSAKSTPSKTAPAPAAEPAEPTETAPTAPADTPVPPTVVVSGGKVELHLRNEDLAAVLELLSREFQINIVASKNAKGRVTADLYQVTIDQAMEAICRANGLQWSREKDTIYLLTPEEETSRRTDESRMVTEVFTLQYLSGEDALKVVAPALSQKAVSAVNTPTEKGIPTGAGGSTGANSFGLSDSLIVRDLPENIERVRDILKRMDRRPRQVLIEATILKVSLEDDTSLGVDFNALAGVDFRELSTTTVPVADPTVRANDLGTPITVPGGTRPWGQIRTDGFAPATPGFNVGVITNNVAFFIHALETVTDTMVVGNPKVLALNKQRSEVKVGKRYGYVTTTHTETTDVQTVNFLDTGTQLIFRPFISDDGYVRMEIHPKVSTGEVIGGLPNETTTEVTCNIMVKDGHTVVIGGLFDETATVARSQVPGLGNIPLLGLAFRSNTDTSKRNEIIILLTPHIIDDDEAANAIGQETLEDANRRCLGVREGFAFFTRERLTTGWMQEADKAWQRYEKTGSWLDRAMAWWNVELVLNASPNTLKAMRLKDQVLSDNKDEPRQPPNWTIWDNLRERLRAMDDQKRAQAEEQKAKAEPPKAEPQTPAPKAPPTGKTPPADKAPPAGKTPSADKTPPAPKTPPAGKTPAAEKAPAAEPKPSVTAMATPPAARDQEVAHAE